MTTNQIRVDIFETTVDMCLDPYRYRTTTPLYAAMIPGSESYFCFADELRNLPRELARVAGTSKEVIPHNLKEPIYFKTYQLADTNQVITIRHTPLSPEKLDEFYAAAIWNISYREELEDRRTHERFVELEKRT